MLAMKEADDVTEFTERGH